ncbi:membrane-bound transcription factor site-2 protease homolog isoform X2 [Euphorbia lathyris]|uniref:membrane-bound transcription factor site-2 protease homolog isoform X2 n=1 Tax=Euphorbia lathyris TaxID=212925 RepID=UPI003313C4FC
MEERRVRRYGRGQNHSVLPLQTSGSRTRYLSNSISCWYCDYKISALNGPLFRFGRRHARFFKVWFSIGILAWELGIIVHVFGESTELKDVLSSFLFGFSPRVYALRLSLADASYLLLSTLISVSVHEFGHAIAAASEGIQTEYIAIFVAVLFPGALVAFNYELLQILQPFDALRVYCAGIWHNALCCAVCGLVVFLLPLVLFPFYVHGEGLMVLEVPFSSSLSGYLSPGDVIVTLDGKRIHNEQEWGEMTILINDKVLQGSKHVENYKGLAIVHGGMSYCISNSLVEESRKISLVDDQSACPDDLMEFVAIKCSDSSELDNDIGYGYSNRTENRHCLNAKDVVKHNTCSHGWVTKTTNGSNCLCSQDESCLSPIQFPGIIWAEITYSSPYAPECVQVEKNSFLHPESANCGGTFVFVGDVISMAHSIQLSSYLPRWPNVFSAYLPKVLEKNLICLFQVSLTIALLNSLPVYLLDGESILEAALCHFTLLGQRKRAKILQACLLFGTITCMVAFFRIFFLSFS